MVPPPAVIPTGPAVYENGTWVCEGPEPPAEVDGYWSCCPSGWKKFRFGDTRPCPDEQDLIKCGPRPDGMDASSTKCCVDGRWAIVGQPGVDPCALPGQVILTPDEILAPELELEREPVITPMMMLAGGAVAITLIGLAFLAR